VHICEKINIDTVLDDAIDRINTVRKHNIAVLLFEPFCDNRGGALATWTREVYSRLEHTWNVNVFASEFGSDSTGYNQVEVSPLRISEFLFKIIKNREFNGLLRPLKRWLQTASARRGGRLITKSQPDIIHIHNDPGAVKWVQKYNPRAIIVLHMQNDHLIEAETVVARDAISDTDYFAFCSEYLMNGALQKFPSLDKNACFIIRNGAMPDMAKDSTVIGDDSEPLLLFVGRIVPNKGVHVLIEAFGKVLDQFPDARLRIVGGVNFGVYELDNYSRKLRNLARPYGARVEFTGPVPHSETYAHFREASVFICPSIWEEPLGMVNAEAMAVGVPIVAFAKGGIPEVVGDAGILLMEITPQALADGICKVLKDPVLAQKMGQRGFERVSSEYNWDVIAKQWSAKLSKMLEEKMMDTSRSHD
jgi:spore coat protein SA